MPPFRALPSFGAGRIFSISVPEAAASRYPPRRTPRLGFPRSRRLIFPPARACRRSENAAKPAKAVRPENFDVFRFIAADVTDKEAADEITRGRRFDVIAANPPYIKTADLQSLDASVRDFEPLRALDGGEDGFRFYRAIIENFSPALSGGGAMIFEIGHDQREGITEIAEKYGFSCKVTRDWGGNDRVAELRRKLDI